jgi:hypothetical protein
MAAQRGAKPAIAGSRLAVLVAALVLAMCRSDSTFNPPLAPVVSSGLVSLPGDVAWVDPAGTQLLLLPPGIDTGGRRIILGEKTAFEDGPITGPAALVEAYRQGVILTADVRGVELPGPPVAVYANTIVLSQRDALPITFGGWGGFLGVDPPRVSAGTTMIFVTPWTQWLPEGDFTTLESLVPMAEAHQPVRFSGEGFLSATGAIQARTILVMRQ